MNFEYCGLFSSPRQQGREGCDFSAPLRVVLVFLSLYCLQIMMKIKSERKFYALTEK